MPNYEKKFSQDLDLALAEAYTPVPISRRAMRRAWRATQKAERRSDRSAIRREFSHMMTQLRQIADMQCYGRIVS
jgi:hypothetical protein